MNTQASTPFLTYNGDGQIDGLAHFARMAFAGADLEPLRAVLLDRAARNRNDANALMDLSTILQLSGQRDLGVSVQAQALNIQQLYRLRCFKEPPGIHLLAIMSPGDLAQNNALELLVEKADI